MTPVTILLTTFALTLTYSVVRYNVLGPVEWSQIPLFIMNKAVSWTGLTLLALAYIRRDKCAARDLGICGAFLTGGHVVMSLAMLTPAYYASSFAGARLSGWGSGAMLAGVAATAALAPPVIATLPGMQAALGVTRWLSWQRAGYWTLALTAVHCALLGWKGWLAPGSWYGGLPPISLLSFLIALAPLSRLAVSRRGSRG